MIRALLILAGLLLLVLLGIPSLCFGWWTT